MRSAMASERTPLQPHGPGAPMYVFSASPARLYRNRIKHFQCCVCAAILAMFVLAVVMTVSYSINHDFDDDDNSTAPTGALDQLRVLLAMPWPVPDEGEPPGQGQWPEEGAAVEAALAAGVEAGAERRRLETSLPLLPVDSPSFRHQAAIATGAEATRLADAGFIMAVASQHLASQLPAVPRGSGPIVSAPWQPPEVCIGEEEEGVLSSACEDASPWRAFNAKCNNKLFPLRGAALRPFRRALPPAYADGTGAPRAGAGGSLPSAREVSLTVHRPKYRADTTFSVMLAVWGQFIDHDITATALSKRSTDGGAISCCSAGASAHPECFSVPLAAPDPFFVQFNATCMDFVRSAPAPQCRFGPREQLNQATSYLDGSVVYGTSEDAAKALRAGAGGRLRMLRTADGRELLPASTDFNDGCNRAEMAAKGRYCFASGDARANENLHLTTMHLLWARQHNRMAAALATRNPGWDDERLYQEARRVVVAQMQHITYEEFVPLLLGRNLTDSLRLRPRESGFADDYDPTVDAAVANVFAAAAFRFAHTLLPGLMRMIANASSSPEAVELHKVLFNPFALYDEEGEGPVLRGALDPGLLRFDPHFSSEVSQHLFERPIAAPAPSSVTARKPVGLDLVSLNIQRGRDHGLPAYPEWRRHCGLSQPRAFEDLSGIVDPESLARIAAIYKSVDDVDAYTGMLSELPVEGGMLGPTLTCLLADQFTRTRRGDRFWYETAEEPQAFTAAQLAEVRKTSLAQVLCDTSDSVSSLQRWVLRAPAADNPRVPCAQLPRADLSAWEESADPDDEHPALVRVKAAAPAARVKAASPLLRPLRVGAQAAVLRVAVDGGGAFSAGGFPLRLPLPLFAAHAAPHSIVSRLTLTASTASVSVSGRFSLPTYGPPPLPGPPAPPAHQFLNGDFDVNLDVFWSNAAAELPAGVSVEGTFVTGVYLAASKKYAALANASAYEVSGGTGVPSAGPAVAPDPALPPPPRASVVLLGAYSADRTSFIWSGNVTMVVPYAVPVPPSAPISLRAEDNVLDPLVAPAWVRQSPSARPPPGTEQAAEGGGLRAGPEAPPSTHLALGVAVASGSVWVEGEGQWWNGSLPLAVPTITSAATSAVWDAMLTRIDNATLRLAGNFSVPVLAPGSPPPYGPTSFPISWKKGNFSLDFTLRWNSTALEGVFVPRSNYSSPIFLRASKPAKPSKQPSKQPSKSDSVVADDAHSMALMQFVESALAATEGTTARAPIILQGNYSADKSAFLWYGNATVILPAPTPAEELLPRVKATGEGTAAVGATVTGGSISGAASGDGTTDILWAGQLPFPITRPTALAKGVTWTGSLTSSSPTEAQLEGAFSTLWPAADNSFTLARGRFALQLSLLWNTSVDNLVSPGVTVFSPLYLQGDPAPDDLDAWFQTDDTTPLHGVPRDYNISAHAENTAAMLRVPVILQGAYSKDMNVFWWSGKVLLIFSAVGQTAVKQLVLTQRPLASTSEVGGGSASTVLGVAVTGGAVTADGAQWWDGTLPLTVPYPAFDRTVVTKGSTKDKGGTPGATGGATGGIIWNGTLSRLNITSLSLSGAYSAPFYIRGPGPLFTIQWQSGTFSLDFTLRWNATLDGIFLEGQNYSSPIIFKAMKPADTPSAIVVTAQKEAERALALGEGEPDIDLMAGPYQRAPVILQGNFSSDKRSFVWGGDALLVLPTPAPAVLAMTSLNAIAARRDQATPSSDKAPSITSKAPSPSAKATSVSAVVTAGVVTDVSGEMLWGGTLPASLSPAISFVVWSGAVTSDPSGAARVEGTYSSSAGVGTFWFSLTPLWGATLDGLVQPGVNYTSPIIPRQQKAVLTQATEGGGAGSVPVILIGTLSPDKASFSWSGAVILSFPSPPPIVP